MIKFVVRTGKVSIGFRKTLKLIKLGKIRYVVVASNIPHEIKSDIEYYASLSGVSIVKFPGTNKELGNVIGKPFSVTVLGIIETGQIPAEVIDNLAKIGG